MDQDTIVQVVIDAASPARLADFWAAALGYRLQEPPPGFDTWQDLLKSSGVPEDHWDDASAIVGPGPRVFFQKVPEPKERKNRVHLDVQVGRGIEDSDERWAVVLRHVDTLRDKGATVIDERKGQWGERWMVLADPEGNEFCVS